MNVVSLLFCFLQILFHDRIVCVLLLSVVLSVLSSAFTYLFLNSNPTSSCQTMVSSSASLPSNNQLEHLQKMYDEKRKVTVMRAVGAWRCFILANDDGSESLGTARPFDIIGNELSPETVEAMYGDQVAAFCMDMPAFPITTHKPLARTKRQAPDNSQNECQNTVIVDCGSNNAGVFKCNTGPGEVYRAQVTCKQNNQFSYSLVNRCKEFDKTKSMRFMKCLQQFLLGLQGDVDQNSAASAAAGPASNQTALLL